MFRNYLLSAIRNAIRQKLYTFINLVGLTLALCCVVLISLYVQSEITFDRWIPDSQNIYRVEILSHPPGQEPMHIAQSPRKLGPTMRAELPEVSGQARIVPQKSTVTIAGRQFPEQINMVDSNFFQVLQLPLAEGQAASVFRTPDSVVISQSTARKYFGDSEAVGKTLVFDGKHALTVTAVMRDLPYNTSISGDIFLPYTSQVNRTPQSANDDWFSFPGWTYVRLAPGTDIGRLEEKTANLFVRHVPSKVAAELAAVMHAPISAFISANVVPLRDVHLSTDQYGGMKPGSSKAAVYGCAVIALLILMIACFNFTNLATARAMMRAREVGLRKVVGAKRGQLVLQFLSESVAFALLALVLAFAIAEVLMPAYGSFLGRQLILRYFENWPLILGLIGVALGAGLLGGFYPALVLSGFCPAAALKPTPTGKSGFGLLRTGLVTAQFAISIGLGIAVIVMFSQMRYARQLDFGFDRNNLIVVTNAQALPESALESYINELKRSPDIVGVAQSSVVPFGEERDHAVLSVPGSQQRVSAIRVAVSPEFASVYRMKLVAGRFLSRERASDTYTGDSSNNPHVVIDRNAARALSLSPQDAVGKVIDWSGVRVTVAGVVQNALLYGARSDATAPYIYFFNAYNLTTITVRAKKGRVSDAIGFMDATWRRFAPDVAIERHFLDEGFDGLYAADEKQGVIIALFVGIAILLACLGLFGLAAFTAERRTKEIGIRKVMGACTRDIVRLLLWQFSIPVLVANAIAWPVAWYYLRHWLDGYAFRIDLNPLYFVAAGAVALFIAWGTVIGHAIRVARANPVQALRYE